MTSLTAEQAMAAAVDAHGRGDSETAEKYYRAILAAAPIKPAFLNLGVILSESGRWAEAKAVYRQALAADPDDNVARLQLALLLLRDGEMAEAWPYYEARVHRPGASRKPSLSFPEWQGEPVRSLLIWQEQGFGDQMQFIRYAQVLADRRVAVSALCPRPLARLYEGLGLSVHVSEGQIELPRHDAWVLSASLPYRMGTTLATIPAPAPFASHPGGEGIGVMVRGNPKYAANAARSLPLHLAQALLTLPGARSLAPEDTGAVDFEDTREIIARLDLVISIDTSVAHLAASMGKPCWLLVPHRADWRWMRERTDSPWYPSMRLFRQPSPGDWDSVMADLKDALAMREQA